MQGIGNNSHTAQEAGLRPAQIDRGLLCRALNAREVADL